jgi:putative transcriptional regulator
VIAHHPPLDMLLDHATGALPAGPRVVVATHAALCADCRRQLDGFAAVGGTMLDLIEPVSVGEGAFQRVIAAIDKIPQAAPQPLRGELAQVLPKPLHRHFEDVPRWRFAGLGIDEIALPLHSPRHRASLLRIRAGRAMARHRHEGLEYTLVLAGGFSDAGAHYGVGDLCLAAGPEHMPVADAGQDCICLAVLDAPLVLTGSLGRLLNPLLRWQHRRVLRAAA